MKIVSSLLIVLACCAPKAFGQYYFYNEDFYESPLIWTIGISAGGMNCLTDLGGRAGSGQNLFKDVNWKSTSACGGIFAGAVYQGLLGARLELAFGQVKANDNVLKNDRSIARQRYLRNLNFRSQIRELSLSIELYLAAIFDNYNDQLFDPYLVGGVGFFSFRPEAFFNNSWVSLSGLHTEGQGFAEYPERKVYKLTQFNMPVGIGISYDASPVLNLKVELNSRKLWTDYLDDVSTTYVDPAVFGQYFSSSKASLAASVADRRWSSAGSTHNAGDIRGNDLKNDSYFSASLKLVVVLGRQRR